MNLEKLVKLISSENAPDICIDSRKVRSGDIFVAIKGTIFDGHDFIGQAIGNGAGHIVAEKAYSSEGVEVICVEDSAEAAAVLAQKSRGNPASRLTNLAVTGTNGKTTVAFLVRSVIEAAGEKCGLISTITYDTGVESRDAELTTPDCITIADAQERMVKGGVRYMVTEASSHALKQNRLAGINFKAAAFTNLAGDHMDYHGTQEAYLAAKSLLFERLSSESTAVLNRQSAYSAEIAAKTRAKILWYGIGGDAEISGHIKSMDIKEAVFELDCGGRKAEVRTALTGEHNVSNCLAAAGLCAAAGFDVDTIAAGLANLKSIPGRLEKVEWDGEFSVLIDYAHTDDALENVLGALKPLCKGKLIVVFGCGGDRDRTKRPRMATVVERLADLIVVTSDNPRGEQAEYIIGEIVTGFEDPVADTIMVEPDREKAIEMAIKAAEKDDIVLIAGKGHETYQIIGTEKFDFSDKTVALKYLNQ